MATLAEYFSADFGTLSVQKNVDLGGPHPCTVIGKCHMDFNAGVRFVSYLVPSGLAELPPYLALIANGPALVASFDAGVEMSSGHPADRGGMITASELPYADRMFIYIEDTISDELRDEMERAGSEILGPHRLTIRDLTYAKIRSSYETPVAFISHDSRDKDPLVRPLADKLRHFMCPVWYDEYSLKVGMSLREEIDKGLRDCPRCILVLSANFMSNTGWSKAEFNAVVGKHIENGGNVILPIWAGVTKALVADYSPIVADVVALNADVGVDELARLLARELKG